MRPWWLGMTGLLLLAAGCDARGSYLVELELDPASLAASVDRIELAVAPSCPSDPGADPSGAVAEPIRLERGAAGRRLDLELPPGRIALWARAWQGCDLVAAGCEEHDVVAGGSGTLAVRLLGRTAAADCPWSEECCGAACVSLDGDRDHCGHCGAACAAGEVCEARACTDPRDAAVPDTGVPADGGEDGGSAPAELCNERDDDGDGAVDEGCCPPAMELRRLGSVLWCVSDLQPPMEPAAATAACRTLGGCPTPPPAEDRCGLFIREAREPSEIFCYYGSMGFGGGWFGPHDWCTTTGLQGREACAAEEVTFCYPLDLTRDYNCAQPFYCGSPPTGPSRLPCTRSSDCGFGQRCDAGACLASATEVCCVSGDCGAGTCAAASSGTSNTGFVGECL